METVMLKADENRFNKHVIITPSCWLWKGARYTNGYGLFHFNEATIGAHRFSYLFYKGPIPPGLIVRHTCDVRNCVNPEHLIVGTHEENTADAKERGRLRFGVLFGENCGSAKIDNQTARQIKDLLKCGLFSHATIARFYKISTKIVGRINRGETWRDV